MKNITFLLLFCIGWPVLSPGQTTDTVKTKPQHEIAFDFGFFYTPVAGNSYFGGYLGFKYYITKRFASGITCGVAEGKLTDTFSYPVTQPLGGFYEIGWLNQYNIVHHDKIRVGLMVNNAFAGASLNDDAIKERYRSKYGYRYRAKRIATNYYYYALEPGVDISVKLFSAGGNPSFYLTTRASYRFVFGETTFGKPSDFSNFNLGAGLTVSGLLY